MKARALQPKKKMLKFVESVFDKSLTDPQLPIEAKRKLEDLDPPTFFTPEMATVKKLKMDLALLEIQPEAVLHKYALDVGYPGLLEMCEDSKLLKAKVCANDAFWAKLVAQDWDGEQARKRAGVSDSDPKAWRKRYQYFYEVLPKMSDIERMKQGDPRVTLVYWGANYNGGRKSLASLFGVLGLTKSVRTLVVDARGNNERYDDIISEFYIGNISGQEKLTALNYMGPSGSSGLEIVLDAASRMDSLTHLSIASDLSGGAMDLINAVLESNKGLKSLSLVHVRNDGRALELRKIARSIYALSNLEELTISDDYQSAQSQLASGQEVVLLFKEAPPPAFHGLKSLDMYLENSPIGDDGMLEIFKVLGGSQKLNYFDLTAGGLSEASLPYISSLLLTCPNLGHLGLRNQNFNKNGDSKMQKALYEGLEHAENLSSLNLSNSIVALPTVVSIYHALVDSSSNIEADFELYFGESPLDSKSIMTLMSLFHRFRFIEIDFDAEVGNDEAFHLITLFENSPWRWPFQGVGAPSDRLDFGGSHPRIDGLTERIKSRLRATGKKNGVEFFQLR